MPDGTVWYARGRPANRPPAFGHLGSLAAEEGAPFRLELPVTDPESDDITITAEGLPEGAALDGKVLSWTPGFDQAGTYEVTLIAGDGASETRRTVTLSVAEINAPVTLASASPSAATLVGPPGTPFTFSVEPRDPDGGTPDISWTLNGDPLPGETGPSLSISATDAAEDRVTVTVSDGESAVSRSWRIARSLLGDFDDNGRVDFPDFVRFAAAFGRPVGDPAVGSPFDLDGSGAVDFRDFVIFAGFFGASSGG